MNRRRLIAATAALATTLSLGATGCGTENIHADTSPDGQQVDARMELVAAARRLTEQTLKFAAETADTTWKGVMDPQARDGAMTVEFLKTGRQLWATVYEDDIYFSVLDVPGVSFGTRFRLPRSEAPAGSHLDVIPDDDPTCSRRLVDAVVDVRRDGERPSNGRRFTGTVDLMATPYADDDLRQKFGGKVNAVPFTATIDDEGRMVEFVIALDTLAPELGKVRAAWSDFGLLLNSRRPERSQPAGDVRDLLRALEG